MIIYDREAKSMTDLSIIYTDYDKLIVTNIKT